MTESVPARLLDVGNCDPDHAMIRAMLEEHFDVEIDRVMFVDEAVERMRNTDYKLVLFNRLTFADGTEAIEVLRRAKRDPAIRHIPIMMVSNFEEAQKGSIALGGEPGFGKKTVNDPATINLLAQYLARKVDR